MPKIFPPYLPAHNENGSEMMFGNVLWGSSLGADIFLVCDISAKCAHLPGFRAGEQIAEASFSHKARDLAV